MTSAFFRYVAFVAILSLLAWLASCGLSNSSTAKSAPGQTPGGYAAGVGGAGQTSAAHYLIAIQVPGGIPFATAIDSSGMLTAATVTMNKNHSENNPFGMNGAIDPSGTFFYEAVRPGIWAFAIDRQTGNLTEISTSPYIDSVNVDSVAVDQLGKYVYAYGGGQVYAFTIQSGTGQLTAVSGSPYPSFPSGEQYAIASDRIVVSQDNKFLYVATSQGIAAYAIDGTSGALTPVSGSPFGASAGASFAITAPSSGFLYETLTGSDSSIYAYSIDSSSGALASITGSPFGPTCNSGNMTSPANGKMLFAAGCGNYRIDAATGALTNVASDPTAPETAWSAFDPTGSMLWILHSQTPCFSCEVGVETFQVDANSGALTAVPNSFFFMTDTEVGDEQALAITQ